MKNKVIAYYSFLIGFSVIIMWPILLISGSITEGTTEMSFHILSEFIMAIICIISAILLLRNRQLGKKLNIIGLSMVVYSTLNAAGYYAQRDQKLMTTMFLVILSLSIVTIVINLVSKK